jgi:acyl-coenzyme A synthetase/AMP-(fatty) acid ligase
MIAIDAEGWVHYRGRADDMLKVSGKWFSPRELEDCLLGHDAVGEVAVVGIADGEGLVKPHAFVVLVEGSGAGGPGLEAELQAWARDRLESYKYPRAVHFLEEMPRTHLGKVDRGKLARG